MIAAFLDAGYLCLVLPIWAGALRDLALDRAENESLGLAVESCSLMDRFWILVLAGSVHSLAGGRGGLLLTILIDHLPILARDFLRPLNW
jgi:hypothetical protein